MLTFVLCVVIALMAIFHLAYRMGTRDNRISITDNDPRGTDGETSIFGIIVIFALIAVGLYLIVPDELKLPLLRSPNNGTEIVKNPSTNHKPEVNISTGDETAVPAPKVPRGGPESFPQLPRNDRSGRQSSPPPTVRPQNEVAPQPYDNTTEKDYTQTSFPDRNATPEVYTPGPGDTVYLYQTIACGDPRNRDKNLRLLRDAGHPATSVLGADNYHHVGHGPFRTAVEAHAYARQYNLDLILKAYVFAN